MKERYGKFYENELMCEHKCCYDTAIVYKTNKGEGKYWKDEIVFLECRWEDVEYILAALNNFIIKDLKKEEV